MTYKVLINGGGSVDDEDAQREEIRAAFEAAGAAAEVEVVEPSDIDDTIRRWWDEDRPEAIVVAGGDGTVNGAAAVAAGTDIVLAVLPLGTFNHFAKDIGMPDGELTDAARAIVEGEVRSVDVAEVNGEVFVNNSALGVYPAMVAVRDELREAKGWGKVRAVPVASIRVLKNLPLHRLDLTADGTQRHHVRTPFVFVGNGLYDNGRGGAAERAGLDDGLLGVAIARTTSRWGLVANALRALVSGADAARDVEQLETTELVVAGRAHRLRVARDGEIGWLALPLRYRCRPGALQVRAPVPPVGDPEPDGDVDVFDHAIGDASADSAS